MLSQQRNILLVEDNAAHAELICRAFESDSSSFSLITCRTLGEARESIHSALPSLLITDLNLPDGRGLELIGEFENNEQCPLILMTSFGNESIAVEAMKLGAQDYIVKSPEAFETMPKVAERVLRERDYVVAKLIAEHALLQKEQEQREILNSMVDGVITINEEGVILTYNKSSEKLFGYTDKDVIGRTINQLMPEPFFSAHDSYLKNFLKTGVTGVIGITREVVGKKQNGETFPMRLSVAELPNSIGDKRRFIGSCQDLSLIKLQEEQLRRAQRMDALGKLTGGIAHDYNNMLGVIMGYAELLKGQLSGQPDLICSVNEIYRAGERGAKLTKKLLAFSRQKEFATKKHDINMLLKNEQDMLEKTLTARIKLTLKLSANLWPVKIDAGELENVILNICINAMHAMEGTGQLIIQTRNVSIDHREAVVLQAVPGNYALLTIEDTGCGISDENIARIFEPFYSTKGERGTGLGLSQAYGFMIRSAGFIYVHSELGKGSCFSLYFPPAIDSTTLSESVEITKTVNLLGTETILIVDDEEALLNLSSLILGSKGYKVLKAENAMQALAILEKNSVDLVFSDIIMPEMDGYQLATVIMRKYPQVKIQLASGFSDDCHATFVNEQLRKSVIQKPYNSTELLVRVRQLLDE